MVCCNCKRKVENFVTKPRTPYNFFLIQLKKPTEVSIAKFQKYAAQKWNDMSDEEKNVFYEQSDQDKDRYKNHLKFLKKMSKLYFNSFKKKSKKIFSRKK
jgi:hypothetical protein